MPRINHKDPGPKATNPDDDGDDDNWKLLVNVIVVGWLRFQDAWVLSAEPAGAVVVDGGGAGDEFVDEDDNVDDPAEAANRDPRQH